MSDRSNKRRRPKRLRWIVGLTLLALIAGAWFAPTIVATTSLRHEILPRLLPEAKAQFSIESASLGWFSPVQLSGIEARDADGKALVTVDSLASEKTLYHLVSDSANLGKFTVVGLTAHADVRELNSNLEDAFGPSLQNGDEDTPTNVQVEIRDSTIHLHDALARRDAQISISQLQLMLAPASEIPLDVVAQGSVGDGAAAGAFEVKAQTQAAAVEGQAVETTHVRVVSDGVPLSPLACMLRRIAGPSDIAGAISGDVNLSFSDVPNSPVQISGQANGQQIQLAAAKWLGQDVFQTSVASFAGDVSIGSQRVMAKNARVQLDHGHVTLNGSIPRSLTGDVSAWQALSVLANEDLQAGGEVNLAQLAAALPDTLRIREDTNITGGSLTFNIDSRTNNGLRAWQVQLATTDITANSAGKAIVWNRPIVLQAAAHQSNAGPVIDRLSCTSDFIEITGQGHLNDATLSARADLTELSQQLGQFIDTQGLALAGSAHGQMRFLRDGQSQWVNVSGKAEMTNLQAVVPSVMAVNEPQLSLSLDARILPSPDYSEYGVQQGAVALTAAADTLAARFSKPVTLSRELTELPLRIDAKGGAASWGNRLNWLLPLDGWNLEGDISLVADVELVGNDVRLISSQCDLNNLVAIGHGHSLREQQAQLTATGNWISAANRLDAKVATVATTSWSLRGDDVVIQFKPAGPPDVNARLALRSDLRRTIASVREARAAPITGVRGIATGDVLLTFVDGIATADVVSQIENLVVETPVQPPAASGPAVRPVATSRAMNTLWTDRQLKLAGRVVYHPAADKLQIPKFEAETNGAKLLCAGELTSLSATPSANIQGQADYNLAALVQRLQPALGSNIQLVGSDTAKFAVQGPLAVTATAAGDTAEASTAGGSGTANTARVPPDLQASTQFKWESAKLYGLPIGEGEFHGQLRKGILDIKPISVAVNDGRLNLSPRFYLNEAPATMTLDRGPLLENVELTPEMCRDWLKYVAPLLADATQCQGRISAHIDRAAFPIDAPETGSLAGTLTIHGADVRAGALAMGYINLVQRVEGVLQGKPPESTALGSSVRLVHLDEQQLNVSMADGRVHHQGLKMKIGDVDVISSGSVGADQSLDLIAEIAVQDSWIEGRSYLVGLQGQTLKIPIRGNVGRPRIDYSLIEEIGRRTLTGAASNVFRNEVNNLLGDLLKQPSDRTPQSPDGLRALQGNPLFRNLLPPEGTAPPAGGAPTQPTIPPLTPPRVEFPGTGGTR